MELRQFDRQKMTDRAFGTARYLSPEEQPIGRRHFILGAEYAIRHFVSPDEASQYLSDSYMNLKEMYLERSRRLDKAMIRLKQLEQEAKDMRIRYMDAMDRLEKLDKLTPALPEYIN